MNLVKYDAACRALAAAKAVDEVMLIRDNAQAIAAAARVAKNHELEIDAAEIRIRAERRLGEMIKTQKETVGLNKGAASGGKKESSRGAYTEPRDTTPTLASVGIDKKLSARSQQIAAIPQDEDGHDPVTHNDRIGPDARLVVPVTALSVGGEIIVPATHPEAGAR